MDDKRQVKTYLVSDTMLHEFKEALIMVERVRGVEALRADAERRLKKAQAALLSKPATYKEVDASR